MAGKKITDYAKLIVILIITAIVCITLSIGFLTYFNVNSDSFYKNESQQTFAQRDGQINGDITSECFRKKPEKKFKSDETLATSESDGYKVFLGGTPIGIVIKSDSLIVAEFVDVIADDGSYSPALRAGLQKGDMILKVDGIKIENIAQLNDIVINAKKPLSITVLRNNEEITFNVLPAYDLTQQSNKIGLKCRGEMTGIGTLTYIKSDNRYGALGHYIADEYGYSENYNIGKIYNSTIIGYKKGIEGRAGELKGRIDLTAASIGTIDKNILTGIYGNIDEQQKLDRKCISVACRDEIKTGKAYIYTTIDGKIPKFYEIEIVKKEKQTELMDKSMVIRITDKELLEKTGGILQGMSGSPIVQNDKLIGAVTHVFISNPSMGYGVYADWMINN